MSGAEIILGNEHFAIVAGNGRAAEPAGIWIAQVVMVAEVKRDDVPYRFELKSIRPENLSSSIRFLSAPEISHDDFYDAPCVSKTWDKREGVRGLGRMSSILDCVRQALPAIGTPPPPLLWLLDSPRRLSTATQAMYPAKQEARTAGSVHR
jgi:hypothetical protein